MSDLNVQQVRANRLLQKINTLNQGKLSAVTPQNPREFTEQQRRVREEAKKAAEQKAKKDDPTNLDFSED